VTPRRLRAAVLAVALIAAPAARTEAPPVVDPTTLTLAEAIALARAHAPALQEARAKVALVRLDVRATRWWTWLIPSVSASPGYDFLAGQERASVALSLDLTKLLGQGAREAERADWALAHAERAVEIAEAAVVEAVTRAHFQLTVTRATVEVRTAAVADALKLEALEAIRFAHGTGDLAPLLHARAALARARLDRLTAEQEAQLAALALRRAIGLPLP
jgi:outer membrane protein TolC